MTSDAIGSLAFFLHRIRNFLQPIWLREVENGRDNNLNLIRFVLASAVIVSHCWGLRGDSSAEPLQASLGYSNLGEVAVHGFFFISGFLIIKSGLRSKTAEEFLAARVLRIFPGLIAAVFMCTFILGPFASTLSVRSYFLNPSTWAFLREMTLYTTLDSLPGVFAHNHYTWADSVFWTLPGEWTMYMLTLVVCLGIRGKQFLGEIPFRTWMLVVAALALTAQMMPLPWHSMKSWFCYFVLGSAFYVLRRWILLSLPVALLMLGVDLILITSNQQRVGVLLLPLALGYALITFGYHPAVHVKSFHRVGDYSYGLYIYAFPIQQLCVPHFQGPLRLFAASYPMALFVAFLSWTFLEKPTLELKHRVSQRPKEDRLPVIN